MVLVLMRLTLDDDRERRARDVTVRVHRHQDVRLPADVLRQRLAVHALARRVELEPGGARESEEIDGEERQVQVASVAVLRVAEYVARYRVVEDVADAHLHASDALVELRRVVNRFLGDGYNHRGRGELGRFSRADPVGDHPCCIRWEYFGRFGRGATPRRRRRRLQKVVRA